MILRSMKLDVCTSDDEKGNVFPGCKKGVPRGLRFPTLKSRAIKKRIFYSIR